MQKDVNKLVSGERIDLLATDSEAGGEKSLSLHFSKMHGLGNDFVMISDHELGALAASGGTKGSGAQDQSPQAEPINGQWLKKFCSKLATTVCDRHFGIGADGLIVAIDLVRMHGAVRNGDAKTKAFDFALQSFTAAYPERDSCDLAWIYVNSDGSYSAMCGNGLRCFTLFARELGLLTLSSCRVATSAYPVVVTIKNDSPCGAINVGTAHGGDASIEVISRLAGPKFAPPEIPLDTSQIPAGLTSFVDQLIEVNGFKLQATCVSMGNPHCVIFEQPGISLARYAADIKEAHTAGKALLDFPPNLLRLAADIQQLSLFPEGVNVEFVQIDSAVPDTALVFVVERGCGATLACASGAAAVLAAGVISGRLNKKSYVILPGGKLEVNLRESFQETLQESGQEPMQNCQQFMELTGPAVKVFSGHVLLPELCV